MLDLLRGAARFAAGSALAGLRGLSARRDGASLDAATWAAWDELSEPLQLAFQLGDDLREDGAEVLAGMLDPGAWGGAAAKLAGGGFDAARFLFPDREGSLARIEWRNKLDVFRWVKGVRRTLGHPPTPERFDLALYVDRAYELPPYPALWAIEGLGHDYAQTFLDDLEGGKKARILTGRTLKSIPDSAWPMLHAGLGLALAEHLMKGLQPRHPRREFRRRLERFVAWCRENARPSYADEALEAFGLEARCFFAQLVPGFGREVTELPGESLLPSYFWHGVGRGMYFVPVNLLPGYGSFWHGVEMTRREAPDELGRTNALAGISYAFAMVNMAHPEVVESVLAQRGEELRATSFPNGVAEAVRVRALITPGAKEIERFVGHGGDETVAHLWREMVHDPCREALRGKGSGSLYQNLGRNGEEPAG